MSAPFPLRKGKRHDDPWSPDAWAGEVDRWRRKDFAAVLKALLEGREADIRGEGPGAGGGFQTPAPRA